jgi:hypothetical protein
MVIDVSVNVSEDVSEAERIIVVFTGDARREDG